MSIEPIKRREFLDQAGRAAAGLAVGASALTASSCATAPKVIAQAPSKSPRPAGEPIRLGFIGVGGRGRQLLRQFQIVGGCEIKALCDVHAEHLKAAAAEAPPKGVDLTGDHRAILKRDDIDAVVIASPDHWHAILTIEACQVGKDVYVEKPLTLCVAEGRRMVEAARKHGRIVQMGTQQRSGPLYQEAKRLIGQGRIGKVTMVRAWNFRNSFPGKGNDPDQPAPKELDWDRWLGPRPVAPYNPIKASGAFRNFWEYSGGILTDWGTHHIDSIQMIMKVDAPQSAVAAGGRFLIHDITDVPDTLSVVYQYPEFTLEYSSRETNGKAPYDSEYGIEFCGHLGTMYLDRAGYRIFSEKDRKKAEVTVGTPGEKNWVPEELDQVHIKNFLDCVRSREFPNTEVEIGHRSTTTAHLGNIAYRTGRKIIWDAEREAIHGDAEAHALLSRTYRKPYVLPQV